MNTRLLHKTRRFGAVILCALIICGFGISSSALADDFAPTGSVAAKDKQDVMGRWIRPDGGYILELTEGRAEGRLNAAYYNPKPIHVARAEHVNKDGQMTIFIELRDVNYPGSAYNLRYDPQTDRLVGTYFQAVQGETYRIAFMRIK